MGWELPIVPVDQIKRENAQWYSAHEHELVRKSWYVRPSIEKKGTPDRHVRVFYLQGDQQEIAELMEAHPGAQFVLTIAYIEKPTQTPSDPD